MTKSVFERAHASVRIFGEDLDPLDVTLALRLPADHTHRKGEPRLYRRQNGVREDSPYPHGMWSMSTRDIIQSPRLVTHIEWLLAELEPKADALRALLTGDRIGDIFCYSMGASSRGPPIARFNRDRAAALGLIIDVDHHETFNYRESS